MSDETPQGDEIPQDDHPSWRPGPGPEFAKLIADLAADVEAGVNGLAEKLGLGTRVCYVVDGKGRFFSREMRWADGQMTRTCMVWPEMFDVPFFFMPAFVDGINVRAIT